MDNSRLQVGKISQSRTFVKWPDCTTTYTCRGCVRERFKEVLKDWLVGHGQIPVLPIDDETETRDLLSHITASITCRDHRIIRERFLPQLV
jgi:hypothetical protein